ncbi:hypothetical protein D3C81_1209120 [compost metagenome]
MAFPGGAQYHSLVLLGFGESAIVKVLTGLSQIWGDEPSWRADRGASGVRDIANGEVAVFCNSLQVAYEMRSI